jgi:hypothetical protein
MKLLRAGLLVGAAAAVTGCATLFSSGSVPVAFQTDTPGAEVWINGTRRGVTPLTLEMDNTKPITVTFKQAGRQDVTVDVGTKVRGGFVVLDVLGGLAPIIIDAATGEWKTLETRTVNANLVQQAGAPRNP